ncbi:hypothetical protein MHH60_14025 [Paenibacillus sp. FSL H7-0716]|nr:hypothetical protein [Paenibacillus odorifer]
MAYAVDVVNYTELGKHGIYDLTTFQKVQAGQMTPLLPPKTKQA